MKTSDFIEQMELTQRPLRKMVEMVPEDKLGWAPAKGFMTVGQLIKHVSENWCVIRMMVKNEWPFSSPEQMAEAMRLENIPSCSKAEALAAMDKDLKETITYVKKGITEQDFFSRVVTAPWGFKGEIWKGVLMAKDHQMNHKMQLHVYLKLLGLPVNTQTLYGG